MKQDSGKARELFEKAAAMNIGSAFNNLGIMYDLGDGVAQDYKKAIELYGKAIALSSTKGGTNAFYNLGLMYEQGTGVKRDRKKALELYTKGAEAGNADSMMSLGRMYEYGLGTKIDLTKAIEFYRQASANGNKQAAKALARLNAPQKPSSPIITKTPAKPAAPSAVALGELPAQELTITKPRVVILAFDDRSEGGNAPANAVINMMTTELFKTGIFRILERERINDIINEQKLGQSGVVDPSTAPKLGRIMGAQYILTGAITLYQYNEKASGFVIPLLGSATKAKTAYVLTDVRIIDAETSEILYAADKLGEAKQTSKTSGKSSKIIDGLLSMATRDSVVKHASAIKGYNWEN